MREFSVVLKVMAIIFIAVGISHLIFGLRSDMSLGALLGPETIGDPVLDSQNRFYGVVFAGNGALLWLCANDPVRHAAVWRIVAWFIFIGGLARLLSTALHGMPTVPVLGLIAVEVAIFPLLIAWHKRLVEQAR